MNAGESIVWPSATTFLGNPETKTTQLVSLLSMNDTRLLLYIKDGCWHIASGDAQRTALLERTLVNDSSSRVLISTRAELDSSVPGLSILQVSEVILQSLVTVANEREEQRVEEIAYGER